MKKQRTGAAGALLDEYEKAIKELQAVISDLSESELKTIVAPETADENCRSIQTILSHVVRSGFVYAIYVQKEKGQPGKPFPEKVFHPTIEGYIKDLDRVIQFTEMVFENITDSELEEPDDAKKMKVSWNQTYDIEQLMEHAIVHILRHRRQVERFKKYAKD